MFNKDMASRGISLSDVFPEKIPTNNRVKYTKGYVDKNKYTCDDLRDIRKRNVNFHGEPQR